MWDSIQPKNTIFRFYLLEFNHISLSPKWADSSSEFAMRVGNVSENSND
ncbi:MAG: hypothetical protein WBL49_05575 [Nitrososphaeraceae archaeon]